MSALHIRPASTAADDGLRLLENLDYQLPWLATVGSGSQWGSEPRSTQEDQLAKYRAKVAQSEADWDSPWSVDWIRAYIAEAEVDGAELTSEQRELAHEVSNGRFRIPVAGMILVGESMEYVRDILPRQDEQDPFIYLAYLLSDRRARPIGEGAGAALLQHAQDEARKLGINRICVDCFGGNEKKLVKYAGLSDKC